MTDSAVEVIREVNEAIGKGGRFERVVETWEYLRAELRRFDRLDGGRYHVVGDLRAKHRTSDTEILASYEQQLEVRDEMLVRGAMKTGGISLG